ncbi:MAG: type IV secretion system DNA-binding domain-containing protein, partial [Candidatus Sungbacteria bacterium]|nr:type IV secretion system DNA-binding domain-containing protein [Candidatus Sungbacteria bacterium]
EPAAKTEEHHLSPKEEEQVKLIEAKGSKPLFETNVRIVASAATAERAEEIVRNIEAAFLQFRDPGLNEFSVKPLKGRELRRGFYRFSFRIFDEGYSSVLSSEELTSIFHFPNVPVETPKLKVVKSREAPPPVNLPAAGILVGYSLFRGERRDVYITEDDRRRHFYIIGQTGTGKTVLMTEMIRQDILAGKGVCFIDPHGDTVEEILGFVPPSRVEDVIYFNPGDTARPMGLNMLEYDPRFPEQKTVVVNELFSIFQKLYGAVPEALGPMFEQYFRNSTLLVMDDPASGNTLLEVERVFADKEFRDLKLSRSENVVVRTFWRDIAEKAGGESALANMAPYITSKFDTFLANEIMRPVIAQEKSAFNFREIMDSGKILLINLSKGRLGELNSSLIGLIIVGKLLMAALSRTDMPEKERRDFYLYIDEFQNVTTKSISHHRPPVSGPA